MDRQVEIQEPDDSSVRMGRATFGIDFYEHQIDESLDTLVPLATPQNGILYFNPKLTLSDRLNPSVSLGVGYRHLFEGPQIILGGNIFYDSDFTNFDHHVNQFGVGVEMMSRWVDFRANYYLPEQNRRRINTNQTTSLSQKVTSSTQALGPVTNSDSVGFGGHNLIETIHGMNETLNTFNVTNSQTTHFWEQYEGAMRGVDTEMGFLIPGLDKYAETRVFGGYYFYENPFGKNLSGFKGRLEVRALPAITLDAAYYQNKEIVGSNWYYGIRVSTPFDIGKIAHGHNPFAGFAEGFKPQQQGSDAERFASRLTENIIRNPHVATVQSKFIEVGQKTVAVDPPTSFITGTPFTKTVVLTLDGTPITITHVASGAAAGGDGTVEHPYMTLTLADADAVKRAIVLLHAGSTFNSQSITLAPNQQLLGDSKNIKNFIKTDQLGTIVMPHIGNSPVMPTITNPGGTIVKVSTNNTISGLNLTNAARAIAAPTGTTNLIVEKSTISNMTVAGLGLDTAPVSNTTIANVTFSGNNQDMVINGSNTTIANVTSTGALHGAIDLTTPSGTTTLMNVNVTGASDFAFRSTTAAAGTVQNFIGFTATGGAAGVDIEGGAGSYNFDSTSALTNTGGASLLVNGGSANVSYGGNITQTMNAPAVSVLGGHTGTVQFTGGTVAASSGPGLQFNNANGTYNFLGTTTLTGGANLQILNNSAGTFGFSTGASIVNGAGQDILIDGSTASLHYSGSASTNSGTLLQVNNHSTGTLQFDTGTLSATGGTGLQFNNAGGTYKFLGTTTLTGGAGLQIVNNSAGAFTFGTGASIVNGSGQDILVDGGTSSLTYSGSASTTSGTLLQVNNHSTGTMQFDTGTLSATGGSGLQFNNADGTYKFLGTTTLTGTTAGVSLTNGSDGTFQFDTATTITNPTGTAFFVNGGASNITYSGNITANTAFALQVLNHSTGTISFNTGNITQTAGVGVQFVNDSGTYNLADTRVSNSTGSAIEVTNSATGTFNFGTVKLADSTGTAVQLNNAGTVNLLGGTIDGAGGNGIFSLNTTLTATGMTLGGDHSKTISGIGVQVINNDGTARLVTISNDSIRSNGSGILTTDGGTAKELTLVLDGNTIETLAGGAPAMSITGSALNSTIVKSMNGGTVTANGTGGGVVFNRVTFDASGTALSGTQVNAGNWNIGQGTAANQRVLNDGLDLKGVTGSLNFGTLNIFNNAGTGLLVDTKTLGTTFALSNSGGTVDTTGGTAMNLDPLTTHLTFTSVTSANSGGAGVIVNGLTNGSTLTIGSTTVTASGGSGIVVQNSNGAILNFGTTTVSNAGGSGIDLSGAGGASVTFGTTLITNPGASGINMSGATGTFIFGDTTINGTAAGQTAFNLNGGNADVTAQSLNINGGGIGIDLRNTINGHTVSITNGGTIQNVGVGVQLGGGTTGDFTQTADAFFTFDVTGGHNSTISGTVAIEARGLVSTASNVEGTYDFRNVTNIVGAENFEPTPGTPFFVASTAHGTGDGSTPQNAAAYTAIAGTPAGTFIVLVNDGSTINIGASTITLQNNDHVDTFGNGRTFSAGTAPINILLPGVAQYTDPFGHGAATITGTGTIFVAASGDLLQNFTMTLGGVGSTGVSASGINGLTVTDVTINGTGSVFSLTNDTGSINLTNNNINVSGGTLLAVNGGSATISLTAGTGSITNSGGAGVNIANTTGGSVTITGVNVTGATSTPLVFDNNKAAFNITGSTFAAGAGVTLLNVDTNVGGSTTTLAFNNTNTLTSTSGTIATIGAGARNIDLSAQNFTNSGTTSANVINVTGQTGGTISFGTVGITGYNNAAGTAVNLQGTGGTVSFADLDVTTTAGAGVNVGAITFAPGSSPTISTVGGAALVMNGTTLSGGAVTFDSVTASNAGAGNSSISLTNVIGSTTLSTVNLSGTQASGITLNNAGTVAVLAGSINGSSGDAISSTNTALTATGLTITTLVLPGGNGITIANNDGVDRVVTLSNDNIISLGEGIHTTDGGHAGELSLVLDGNTIETNSGGTLAIHVIGSALNSTTINSMSGDTVMADGSGSGVLFNQVTFDAVTGGAVQQVNAGTWNIGQGVTAAQRVSFNGLDFEGATGSLAFGTLNIFNNQGTGLVVNTKTLGTTFTLANTAGTIDTSNGTAMNLDPLTANLTFTSVKSVNSTTSGVILNTVGGSVALGNVTVTGATGTGLSIVNSSAAVTASSVTVNGAATGLQFGTNTGGSFTVSGATSLTNITGTGINANGATGTYQFAGLTIGFTGAGRGLDLRNSDVAFTTGTLSITGNGTAGSIGIDLSGSVNPNGVNSTTPNILLATGGGQTATISNVATGVLLGDVANGSAGAYMKFGNQTPTGSGGSGSSISVIAGGTTIDTTHLTSTTGFDEGRYEFTGVSFTGNASFEHSANFFFVAANATGAGDGSTVNDRANAATLITDLNGNLLANKTIVLINDGNVITLASTANLDANDNIDGFGNGNSVAAFTVPVNVIIDAFTGTVSDPTGNGAATLTTASGHNLINLSGGNSIKNVTLSGGDFVIAGTSTNLTVQGNTITSGALGVFKFVNSSGTTTITNNTISGGGSLLTVDLGTAGITLSAGTGSISNTGGSGISIKNTTGGSVTLTGLSVTGATATPLTFDNNKATFAITNSTFAVNSGVTLLVVDAGVGGSTTALTFGATDTLTQTSGQIALIGAGARNIDLSAQNFTNTGTSAVANVISVTGQTGGTISFGTIGISGYNNAAGTAVNLQGTGGTDSFVNLTVATTAGAGVNTGAITFAPGSSPSINATGGPALVMNGTTLSGGAATFSSITDSNAGAGNAAISLTNVIGATTFTTVNLSGTATNGIKLSGDGAVTVSGGTINGTSGDAITSTNTALTVTGVTIGGTTAPGGNGITIVNNDGTARLVTLSNDTITAAGNGIATTDGGHAKELTLVLDGDTLQTNTLGKFALSVTGSAANSTIIKSMNGGTVNGGAASGGVLFNRVTFDASGTALSGTQVNAGNWNIGQSTSVRVQGNALDFEGPTGNLAFGTLNIFNNNGTGLLVNTKTLGTTFSLSNTSGAIDTTAGTAANLDPLTANLTFTSVKSANSPTSGVILNTVGGTVNLGAVTVSGATGSGLSMVGSSANVTLSSLTVTTTPTGLTFGNNSGTFEVTGNTSLTDTTTGIVATNSTGTYKFDGTTTIGAPTGISANGASGSWTFTGNTTINFSGANRGLDLRNTQFTLFQTGTIAITGDGTAGSIGLDLSGSKYSTGTQPVTTPANITLAHAAGKTATISNVATGILLGSVADGSAGAYLQYGNQTPTGSGGSGSSISASNLTLDTSHLTSTTGFQQGRYEFTGVTFTGSASFQASSNFFFVAANATGTGDGSSVNNRARAAAMLTDLGTNALANKTIVLINDGNVITLGNNTATLDAGTNITGFGNGNSVSAYTIPVNVIIDSFSGTVTDPTGNGAATLTANSGNNVVTLTGTHSLTNINLTGGNFLVAGSGFTGLTVQGVGLSGAGTGVFSFTNPTGTINITNNTINQSGGSLLVLNGGSANVSLTAGTGSISNTGGSGINIKNTTGGSVTLTGLSVTGATATPLTFDNNKATFAITNSTFAVNSGVTLLNVDTTTGGSTTALTFGATDTLTQTSGEIAIIGAGGRNIDLSAQNFTNTGTTAANVISVTGQTGGTISFGTIGISGYNNAAGTAVSLQGTGGTDSFVNLTVATTAGAGVNTGAITFAPGSSPSINATGGPALVMNGTTLSGGAATFSSITDSNAGAGNAAISLTNVIGTTTFTTVNLSGTATNGIKLSGDGAVTVSGGTINGTSGDAITSTNTALTVTGVTIGGTSAPVGNGITIVNNDGTARLVTLSNDTITAAGNGIATTDGGHLKELTLVLDGDTLQTITNGKFALTVTGSALNSTIIKSMNGGTITGGATGGGVLFNRVTFDASGTALSGTQVNAGNWNIGQSTSVRVQGNALDFEGPTGNLAFGTLNIFNNNGTGLLVNTKTLSTTFSLSNTTGAIDTTTGTAANLDPLTANLTFTSVKSANSPTSGVILNTVGGTVNLGAVTVTSATANGLSFVNSSGAITASSVTVTGAATGLQFGANTGGSFTVTGATSLTGITGTGINANGATGTYSFQGNTTITFSGAGRGIDLQNSNVTQFSTANITITGDGTTAGSIGLDLSGSLYPGGQPVGTTTPNINLATASGKTAAISGVTTGIALGNTANGSAGAYLRYGNQTPIGSGGSGSSISVNSGGVTIDTSHLTSVSASQQGRYEFGGVTFTGLSSFEGSNPNFIFVGSSSAGADTGADPNNRISLAQFLASDNTTAFLANKTIIFVNDGSINLGGSTLNMGTNTTVESFGNGATVVVPGGVQPVNVIGDNFHPGGGSFTSGLGAATLTANSTTSIFTLGNGDTVQNLNVNGGNEQILGQYITGFTMSGVNLTNANDSAIFLQNVSGTISMTGGSISGAQNVAGHAAFFVTAGSPNITYSGTLTNTTSHSVLVQALLGGSVTLSGTITDTGAGVLIQSNSGGAITFSGANDSFHTGTNQAITLNANTGGKVDFTGGGLSIQTTTATAFGVNGGTVGVTGTGNTITSTTGTALSLNGATIDTGGFNLQSVSANGAVNGIALNNLTGAAFNSITVSGGTIQNTTGAAVSLTSLGSLNGGVILGNMTISGASGIVGTTFGTLATSNDSVSGTAGAGLSLTTGTIGTGSTFSTLSSTGGVNGVLLSGVSGGFTASAGSLATASGATWSESGGTVNATYNGTISQLNAANAVSISGETAGTTTFGGAITATTTTANAINLTSNTGATIVFSNTSGNSAITTTSGNGFNITGGGTVNITGNNYIINSTSGIGYNATGGTVSATGGAGNTITSTTGTALNVAGATIAAAGLTFKSITTTTSSANAGIILDGTGSLGGLTVTGSGITAGSGGTISNKTGADILTGTDSGGQTVSGTGGTGIFLRNTMGVSLNDMQLNDFSNFAIYGNNVTGFNLSNSTISGTNGTNAASNAEEASIRFDNLLTNATFTFATIVNSNISGGAASNLYIANTSGTLNRLTMTGNTFGFVSSTIGNNNIDIQAYNSGTTLNVTFGGDAAGAGNTINGSRAALFQTIANQNTTMDVVIRHNTFLNNQTSIISGGGEVDVRSGAAGANTTLTFDISHNSWTAPTASGSPTPGAAFFVAHDSDSGTMQGTINANTIVGGTFDNMGDGIFVRASGSGTSTVLISNNNISNFYNDGIALQNNSGSGTMNGTIIGNTITNNANGITLSFAAIDIENGATATDTTKMNIQVGSVTVPASQNSFVGAGGVIDIELSNHSGSTTLDLFKAGSTSSTPTAVIQDDNTGSPTVDTTGGTGTTVLTTTAPPLPPAVAP